MLKSLLILSVAILPSLALAASSHSVDSDTQISRVQLIPKPLYTPWNELKLGLAKSWLRQLRIAKTDKTLTDIRDKFLAAATDAEKAKMTRLLQESQELMQLLDVQYKKRQIAVESEKEALLAIEKKIAKGRIAAINELRDIRDAIMKRAFENVVIKGALATATMNGRAFEVELGDGSDSVLRIQGTGSDFVVGVPAKSGLNGKNEFPDGQPAETRMEDMQLDLSIEFDMKGNSSHRYQMFKSNGNRVGTGDLAGIIDEYFTEGFGGTYDPTQISDQADKLIDGMEKRHFAP